MKKKSTTKIRFWYPLECRQLVWSIYIKYSSIYIFKLGKCIQHDSSKEKEKKICTQQIQVSIKTNLLAKNPKTEPCDVQNCCFSHSLLHQISSTPLTPYFDWFYIWLFSLYIHTLVTPLPNQLLTFSTTKSSLALSLNLAVWTPKLKL